MSTRSILRSLAAAAVLGLLAAPGIARPEAEDLPTAKAEDVGMSSERLARLSAALDGYAERDELAGGVVLVARRGRVVLHHAFGDRDREPADPMETGDIFRIASQSKALVSVATMMLQEEGALLISHPVGRYLPAFLETEVAEDRPGGGYAVVPARRPVTLRDLLTHTAGVGYGMGPTAHLWEDAGIQGWYFADREEPVRDTIDRLASLPFDAHPGERYVYGYSTDILGAVLEVASGMPLDELLGTRLLEPLGMADTHFYLPPEKKDRLTVVYSADEDGISEAPDPGAMVGQGQYLEGPRQSFSGGAGLLSTASDYARFLQMMLNGGELDGHRFLSRKTVELMTQNHVGALYDWQKGAGFGLGFRVVLDVGAGGRHGTAGEFGWGGAYHSTYWVDPAEELVVVYLTQLIPAGGLDDQETLRSLVYSAIVD